MAPKTITYGNSKPLTGANLQPLASIVLAGPAANITIANVLVDTGADLLQVPLNLATAAGYPLLSGTKVPIRTAGSPIYMVLLSGMYVEIEGKRVKVDMLCHPSSTSRALLGRQALAALSDYGFDATNWHWL